MLSSKDIKNTNFNVKMRGYDTKQVNDFMNKVSSTLDTLNTKINTLATKADKDKKAYEKLHHDSQSIGSSILIAQTTANKMKREAHKHIKKESKDARSKINYKLEKADVKAHQIIHSANQSAHDKLIDTNNTSKQRMQKAMVNVNKLITEYKNLKDNTNAFRSQISNMFKKQLAMINSKDWSNIMNNHSKEVFKDSVDLANRMSRKNILKSSADNSNHRKATAVVYYPNKKSTKLNSVK